MMRILSSLRRPWLALLLGAQLSGAAAPLADARLEAEVAGPVHIEAPTDRSCDPVHLHEDCVLCQFLAHRDLLPPPSTRLADRPAEVALPSGFTSRPAASAATLIERGRAPPTV